MCQIRNRILVAFHKIVEVFEDCVIDFYQQDSHLYDT